MAKEIKWMLGFGNMASNYANTSDFLDYLKKTNLIPFLNIISSTNKISIESLTLNNIPLKGIAYGDSSGNYSALSTSFVPEPGVRKYFGFRMYIFIKATKTGVVAGIRYTDNTSITPANSTYTRDNLSDENHYIEMMVDGSNNTAVMVVDGVAVTGAVPLAAGQSGFQLYIADSPLATKSSHMGNSGILLMDFYYAESTTGELSYYGPKFSVRSLPPVKVTGDGYFNTKGADMATELAYLVRDNLDTTSGGYTVITDQKGEIDYSVQPLYQNSPPLDPLDTVIAIGISSNCIPGNYPLKQNLASHSENPVAFSQTTFDAVVDGGYSSVLTVSSSAININDVLLLDYFTTTKASL